MPAEHTCPALVVNPVTDPATAASRSASAKMMFADFPPNSRVTGMMRSAAILPMARPVATEPVNATFATPGCCDQGGAGARSGAEHHVERPGRESDLGRQLRETHGGRGGALRRLDHHGVARGQRRRGGAGRLVERHVPRRDHPDHPEGFASGVDVLIGRHVEGLTGRHAHQTAVELEVGCGVVDLGEGDGLGLAGFAALECGQAILVGAHGAAQIDQ